MMFCVFFEVSLATEAAFATTRNTRPIPTAHSGHQKVFGPDTKSPLIRRALGRWAKVLGGGS